MTVLTLTCHISWAERLHKDKKKMITPHNDSLGCLCSSAIGSSKVASIFLKSQWHQASETLKNVVNFVKHALHVTKTCHVSFTNIHSFVLQTKHFHWSSRHSCLGNCLIWKINMCEKTFTLHGWTQMVVNESCYNMRCLVMFITAVWGKLSH